MRLVTIARAKNEAENIAEFIQSYSWVDRVVIVDGGSEDDTAAIARDCGADIFYFDEQVERNGVFRNPHGKHWNKAIDLAETVLKADYIIHDDVDCTPNTLLREHGRKIFQDTRKPFIYATRVYLYKDRGYASKMSHSDVGWEQSLWAWKANRGFRFDETDPFVHTFQEPEGTDIWRIKPPAALLHKPWPTDEAINRKRDFYSKIYDRETSHPLDFCGEIKPLESWMK